MTDQTLPLPPPPPFPPPPISTPKNWAPCSNFSLFLFHVFGNFMTSKVTGTQLSWAFFCRKSLENRTESKPVQYHRKYLKKSDAIFYLVNVFLTVEVGQWTIYDERYLKPKQNAQLLYQPPAHLFVPPSSLVHYSYMNHFEILWSMDVLIIVNLKVNLGSKIPYYDKEGSHTPGTFFPALWLRAALHYLNAWDKQLCKLKVMFLLAEG